MAELAYLHSQTEVTLADQDAVVIGELYRKAKSSVIDSVHHLIEAGRRLIAKKASLRHGYWLPWLEDNRDALGFGVSAANKLMKAATKFVVDYEFGETEALQISRIAWGNLNNDALRGTRGTGDNEWFTPAEYIEAARKVLGTIDLDPATHPIAQKFIQAKKSFIRTEDGLTKTWQGRVWLNPPYGRDEIGSFIDKLIAEIKLGNVSAALLLTHNYTDTEWFHNAASMSNALCFVRGRIKFIDDTGEPANPTQGQVFFYYGSKIKLFRQVFGGLGLGGLCATVSNEIDE